MGTHLNTCRCNSNSTHNICLHKVVDEKYTGCNLKTTILLGCVLIEACAIIRSNTVCLEQISTVSKMFEPLKFNCI